MQTAQGMSVLVSGVVQSADIKMVMVFKTHLISRHTTIC